MKVEEDDNSVHETSYPDSKSRNVGTPCSLVAGR
jgi:hypothetical protein